MQIPVYDDYHFFDDLSGNLLWLNDGFSHEALEQIQKGLSQQEFKPNHNKSGYLDDTNLTKPRLLTHRHA